METRENVLDIARGLLIFLAAIDNVHADGGADPTQRLAWVTKVMSTGRASGFRSMDQVFPYHRVERGGPIATLPRAPRKLEVSYEFDAVSHTLDELLVRTGTQGFLVIKGGAIVDERYMGGADDKTKFTSWSMAKSVTLTLVGLALAEGKIHSIDDSVTPYVPEVKGTAYDGVPIKDILSRTSWRCHGRRVYRGREQYRIRPLEDVDDDDGYRVRDAERLCQVDQAPAPRRPEADGPIAASTPACSGCWLTA
jgi:hypothetical protein